MHITMTEKMADGYLTFIISLGLPQLEIPAVKTAQFGGEIVQPGQVLPAELWEWRFPSPEKGEAYNLYEFLKYHPKINQWEGTESPFPREAIPYLAPTSRIYSHQYGDSNVIRKDLRND